jgi:hypothetical protein
MLLVLLGSGVLWAGHPWKDKPWTEWTEEDVQEVLTKSPWIRNAKLYAGARRVVVDLSGDPNERVLYINPELPPTHRRTHERRQYRDVSVHWLSSVTVQQALARHRQLTGSISLQEAQQEVNQLHPSDKEYLISVLNALRWEKPFSMVLSPTQSEALEVYLQPKRSGQRVLPTWVGGNGLQTVFRFPRELDGKPSIEPQETKVEFSCCGVRIADGKRKSLKVTFDLRKMVRDGKPDL